MKLEERKDKKDFVTNLDVVMLILIILGSYYIDNFLTSSIAIILFSIYCMRYYGGIYELKLKEKK